MASLSAPVQSFAGLSGFERQFWLQHERVPRIEQHGWQDLPLLRRQFATNRLSEPPLELYDQSEFSLIFPLSDCTSAVFFARWTALVQSFGNFTAHVVPLFPMNNRRSPTDYCSLVDCHEGSYTLTLALSQRERGQ